MEQKKNAALLVMDMQDAILGRLPDRAGLLVNTANAIGAARAAGIPVIYVVVTFRAGAPEVSSRNKSFGAMVNPEMWTDEFVQQWSQINADVAPKAGDVVVAKRRVSAFTGSDLEVVLRAKEVQHLVLTGIATSGVVLSTLREAADKDYQLTVLADCCADADEEVHRVLTTKVFPRQAEVMNVADWKA